MPAVPVELLPKAMQELVVQVKVGLLMCKDDGCDSVDDANIQARLVL